MSVEQALVRHARPTDAPALAAFHLQAWCDAYRGLVPDPMVERPTLADRLTLWRAVLALPESRRMVLVAGRGEAIVGFVSGGGPDDALSPFDSEIHGLYVAQARWRTGLGARLLAAGARELAGRGAGDLVIWTLSVNERARAFYRAQGGIEWGRRQQRFFGVAQDETAYAWPRIAALAGQA